MFHKFFEICPLDKIKCTPFRVYGAVMRKKTKFNKENETFNVNLSYFVKFIASTHHIKYKAYISLVVTHPFWQINFLQLIWNEFMDELDLRQNGNL